MRRCLRREGSPAAFSGIAPPTAAQIARHIGKTADSFLRAFLPPKIEPGALSGRFHTLERDVVRREGRLFPGVADMLAALAAGGHELILCSNGSPAYIDLVLDVTGIAPYFRTRHSAKAYPSKAARLAPDSAAAVVGDTASDIAAATGNRLPSIFAAYGYGCDGAGGAATFVARDVSEIAGFAAQLDVLSSSSSGCSLRSTGSSGSAAWIRRAKLFLQSDSHGF